MDTPDPRTKKRYYFTDTPQRRAMVTVARSIFALLMDMSVEGLEHVPASGPVILTANHVTNFDVFPMQFAYPRPIFFMGKAELFRIPLLEVGLRNMGGFPVNRGEKDQWAMDHALKLLEHGRTVGIFPEGRRSKGGGLRVAKTGAARLAIEADCPILPMAVTGSDRFFRHFPRRTRVHIRIVPAIEPEPGESPLTLTERMMFALAQGLPEHMRGVYAEAPEGFPV